MPYLCKSCAKDEVLQSLAQVGDQPRVCLLCEQCSDTNIDLENRRVREVLRSLLRYHFDELEYNYHFGGDSIDELLSRPNPIVVHSNPEGVEALCGEAFESGYENNETGVSLFAGYAEGEQLPLLEALQRSRDPFLRQVRKRLKAENYFNLKPAVRSRLEPHRSRVARPLSNSTFFRARIGFHKRGLEIDTRQLAYVPHSGSLLLAPPPPIASAGRINRAGVSFLYVASTAATAIAEIRPHPGHLVSTGQVQQIAPCVIADFSRIDPNDYFLSDAELDEFVFLRSIERDLSTPVVPEERDHYLLSQLIADVLREMDFQGVAYRSSVADGTNYCFFVPSLFEYVANSGTVTEILALSYTTEPRRSIRELDDDYVAV